MKYIYLPLACLLLIFSSCKKDDNSSNSSNQIFDITGSWEMTNYTENGVNYTNSFSVYEADIAADGTAELTLEQGNSGTETSYTYILNDDQTTLILTGVTEQTYNVATGGDTSPLNDYTSHSSTYSVSNFTNNTITLTLVSTTTSGLNTQVITLVKSNSGNQIFDITGFWEMTNYIENGVNNTNSFSVFDADIAADGTAELTQEIGNLGYEFSYTYTLNADQTTLILTGVTQQTYDVSTLNSTSPLNDYSSHLSTYSVSNFTNNTITLTLVSTTTLGLNSQVITLGK